MPPARLTAARLADHLVLEPPATRRLVRLLRRNILKAVPAAAEAVKFHALCYYHADAFFGAIGGNICMIELPRKPGAPVMLSFIHGAHLADPHGLLGGRGKSKRFIPIETVDAASDRRIIALVRSAAKLQPWD